MFRCAQHDRAIIPSVTLSRSEGSLATGRQMLRCAQHDRAVTPTNARIILFICIIESEQWYTIDYDTKFY